MLELFRTWGTVEAEVEADRAKERYPFVLIASVFREAVLFEPAFRIVLFIDLSLPTVVRPGGGAKPHQGRQCHATLYSDGQRPEHAQRHCNLAASSLYSRLLMSHESHRRRASETIVFRLGPGKRLLLVTASLLLAYGIALVTFMVR